MPTGNDSPQKKAARIAAAEFSADHEKAAKFYAKSTKQSFSHWRDALEEMKSLLHAYRWPVSDIFAEECIFFNPFLLGGGIERDKELQCKASATVDTRLMVTIKKLMDTPDGEKVRDDLEAIYEAFLSAQNLQLELNKVKGERNMLEVVLGNAKEIFESEEYNTPDKNRNMAQKRNRAIVESLNLSNKRTMRSVLYREYINFVRHDNLDRKQAITHLVEGYNLGSEAGCAKQLSRAVKDVRDSWANVFYAQKKIFPNINLMLKKIVPKI
ncbi:MAG: hypothetical protein J7M06_04765 [Proteobacteria bacterium]|nr:hypothetical protein [Pseudomonadota bacterium]